eukprot:TRINITY_DN3198_c0_g1_i3.p1 TRINITY_DN3198_c0_g1~~TRINITY_DN3198_c0_g1_i3.p1  ORF type:complete len:116 (+),score=16.25 TRINITY_DN3198_c0_g1_i3:161-508(+)
MGRRKSRKKPTQKRKLEALPGVFDCPFCVHTGSVECEIKKREGYALIKCRVCNVDWRANHVTDLTKPCDVFNDWIDSCDAQNRGEPLETYEEEYEQQQPEPQYPHYDAGESNSEE